MSKSKPEIYDIDTIIRKDTSNIVPDLLLYKEIIYSKLGHKKYEAWHDSEFNGNIATRFYEDDNYARAYALSSYETGVLVIVDKKNDDFAILLLGEDDGTWFITENNVLNWIHGKSSFISLVSEALSLFNSNYVSHEIKR